MALVVPGEEDPAVTALRKLVAEIAAGDYRAQPGMRLTNNTAYLEAVALLETLDILERRSRPGVNS
jgi:hypothetical protein